MDLSVGVCFPRGFRAAGVTAGIKASGAPDVAIVVGDSGSTGAGLFTLNRAAAAPVILSRAAVADGDVRAIVTNSGNANAATGEQGWRDAVAMAELTAESLRLDAAQVVVCSTGVIGQPLPIDRVRAGIAEAVTSLSPAGGKAAAEAIRTTDAHPKLAQASLEFGGTDVRIGAIGKGAGMICPNVATTLVQVTTDAEIAPPLLRELLTEAAARSLNAISVDGSESTNDSLVILASGMSGVRIDHTTRHAFLNSLTDVVLSIDKQIVADGDRTGTRPTRHLRRGCVKVCALHADGRRKSC